MLLKDRSGHCFRCPGEQQGRFSPGRIDPSESHPALPRPTPPLRRAPRRPDPPVVCPGFGLNKLTARCVSESFYIPGHALRAKVCRNKKSESPVVSQQQGTKSAFHPADKTRARCGFVLPSVYLGFRLFVLLKNRPGQLSSNPRTAKRTVVPSANKPAGVPNRPATPPCVAPTRPSVCPGFGIDQKNSTYACASENSFKKMFSTR